LADHREVIHERLYLKEPNTERLRKTSAGRLRSLLSDGWRETDRWMRGEYIEVRLERTGVAPLSARLPKKGPEPRFERRRGDRPGGGPFRGPRGPRR
jgi:hypothetical protein